MSSKFNIGDTVRVIQTTEDVNKIGEIIDTHKKHSEYYIIKGCTHPYRDDQLELVSKVKKESKFKVGDKVKIPLTKSVGDSYESFRRDLNYYKLDYLIITRIDYDYLGHNNCICVKTVSSNIFLPTDLELYEEETQINNSQIINNYSIF